MADERKQPSLASYKKKLLRGLDVILPTGEAGVFLEFCKGSKAQCWVLRGGRDGPKRVVPADELIRKTWKL